jgi:dihydroxyacetone kinase-like predicted kinase
MIQKFSLEFILQVYEGSDKTIRNSLTEFGDNLEVTPVENEPGGGMNFKVNVSTEDPTMIFDICSQIGRIKSVKVNEV